MQYQNETQKLLWRLGVNATYQGFDHIVYGVSLGARETERLERITKELYPEIAKQYNTSWKCVERDIRTVVEVIWNYGNRELLIEIYGEPLEKRPKNAKFLKRLVRYLTDGK